MAMTNQCVNQLTVNIQKQSMRRRSISAHVFMNAPSAFASSNQNTGQLVPLNQHKINHLTC
jgi:hypothetical protein